MSQQRAISSYFGRSTSRQQNLERDASLTTSLDGLLESSSPLSSSPLIPSSAFATPSAIRRTSNVRNRLQDVISSEPDDKNDVVSGQSRAESSFRSSLSGSSQRVVKNGKVVVTNSDSDTDSISSLESPDELLARFMSQAKTEPADTDADTNNNSSTMAQRGGSSSRFGKKSISMEIPKYSFSLDDLVHHAVDDNEMQEKSRKAREEMEKNAKRRQQERLGRGMSRDDIISALVGDDVDAIDRQRVEQMLERTEAFEESKTWSFFEDTACPPSPHRFPQKSIAPGYWGGVLRDPNSRERAFFSGIVGEILADGGLPDELIFWILHAVTVEPRDELRYAYCSSLKLIPAGRLSNLINPSHIEQLFRRIGARPGALAMNETVEPVYASIYFCHESRDYRRLLSVLDIVGGISNKLNHATREHLLKILLRLALDEKCMDDSSVCVAVQDIIVTLLRESKDQLSDLSLYEISMGLYNTVQEIPLQNQLLKQIMPASPRVALFRTRLALAFLYQDPSPMDRPQEHLIDLGRIRTQLFGSRFDVYRGHVDLKPEELDGSKLNDAPLDYYSFAALTSILDMAIDSGTTLDTASFASNKQEEEKFNCNVDRLADVIKGLFTSIKDSGASHLKRIEAKESLQTLHFRLLYGVRTKERPKKSLFAITNTKHKPKQSQIKFSKKVEPNNKNEDGQVKDASLSPKQSFLAADDSIS